MLIIGIGNRHRGDDGIGSWVVQKLREQSLPVEIIEHCGDGAELMELWKSRDSVVIIDAVQARSSLGDLYRIEAHKDEVPADFFHYSTHAFSVAEAVELARVLDQLPPLLTIYGIVGENFKMGADISPKVKETALKVVDNIIDDIRNKE